MCGRLQINSKRNILVIKYEVLMTGRCNDIRDCDHYSIINKIIIIISLAALYT